MSEASVNKSCTRCRELLTLDRFYTAGKKVSGEPKYNSWCKACVSEKQALYHKRTWGPERLQHSAYQRTKSVRAFLIYLRCKAVQRSKGIVLGIDSLLAIWQAQDGKCALSGWNMTMQLGRGIVPTNCSVDRISPDGGYEEDNVQLVCRAVNVAKSNLSQSDFIALCRSVAEKYNG